MNKVIKSKDMKLFIWKNALCNGIAFAFAENIEEARELILEKYKQEQSYVSDILISDLISEPLIVDYKEGFYLWGDK